MNEKEFLQQATSKIYSFRKKQVIANELHDHIQLKKKRFEEAGYTEEQAEEKAVDNMGDADKIAKALAELHKSYNAAPDILLFLIVEAVITGSYYLLENFVFGDPGVLSLLISGILGGIALFCLYAAYASFRKHPVAALCTLLAGAGIGYYEYLLTSELSRLTDGAFAALKNYILNGDLYFNRNQQTNELLTAVCSVTGVLFAAIFLFVLLFGIKKVLYKNNRMDNTVNKITTGFCITLFAVSAVLSAYFGFSTINRIENLKKEYAAAFQFVVDIEKNCNTQEEVTAFIENSGYAFSPVGSEEVEGYVYEHNLVTIRIDFADEPETIDPNEYERGAERLFGRLSNNIERASRTVYGIDLRPDPLLFAKEYDSITLSALKTDEKTVEALYRFRPYEHTNQERYEYFIQYTPTAFYYDKCNRELDNTNFEFQYIEGTGETKDTNYFEFTTETQELLDFIERERNIVEVLKSTDSRNADEIARLTGTTATDPGFTRDEYNEFIDYCCINLGKDSATYQNKDLLLDLYDSFIEYQIYDDWKFTLYRLDGENIVIFDNHDDPLGFLSNPKDLYMDEVDLNGKPIYGVSEYNCFKKVLLDGGFFDKKGLYYDNAEKIRYYTEGGEVYRYYSTLDMDEPGDDKRKYFLKDKKGNLYSADRCFIDQNGWLVIDKQGAIKESTDGTYKNSAGEVFTAVFKTSWDGNGNLVDVNAYE